MPTFLRCSGLFSSLADANRIKLFWFLCHMEECVINLSALMHMSSPALSHHLKILRENGLITSRRAGKEMYYKAANTEEVRLLHHMIELLIDITCPEQEAEAEKSEESSPLFLPVLEGRTVELLAEGFYVVTG